MEWHENTSSTLPKSDSLYDNKYVRVLADDEGGFVREAFYDPAEKDFFAISFRRSKKLEYPKNFTCFPLIVTRWAYLPKTENHETRI